MCNLSEESAVVREGVSAGLYTCNYFHLCIPTYESMYCVQGLEDCKEKLITCNIKRVNKGLGSLFNDDFNDVFCVRT